MAYSKKLRKVDMRKISLILLVSLALTGCSLNNDIEVISNSDKYLNSRYGENKTFVFQDVESNKVLVNTDILSDNTGFIIMTTDVDDLDAYEDYYEYTYACREVAENIEWYVQKVNRENNIKVDITSTNKGISSKEIDNKELENVTLKSLYDNNLDSEVELNVFVAEQVKDIHLDDIYDSLTIGLNNHTYLSGNITIYENVSNSDYKNIISGLELSWSSGFNKISSAAFENGIITNRNDREVNN